MSRPQPKARTLEQETAFWYKKLKKDGFEDIEQKDGNLKFWASRFFMIRHNDVLYQAKEEYYRLAGQFLHDYKFPNEFERNIWALHADGISIRDIVKILNKKRFRASKDSVHRVLQRLTEEMVAKCR